MVFGNTLGTYKGMLDKIMHLYELILIQTKTNLIFYLFLDISPAYK